jgi:hypothetical protein
LSRKALLPFFTNGAPHAFVMLPVLAGPEK